MLVSPAILTSDRCAAGPEPLLPPCLHGIESRRLATGGLGLTGQLSGVPRPRPDERYLAQLWLVLRGVRRGDADRQGSGGRGRDPVGAGHPGRGRELRL